ncbi:Thymidylate kinase [Fulvia fulva]|uniref:Thymidylate kinase n=1 Tax=Passalora fulva TaxID=5499 RepID=A0A9Q8PAP2_PASFU|nr:Thymidylate kinase [Fulvia fulva]KAK4621772.1 Thymidylate kinase [Fulvia fulva]KAK4622707.1 Thymidylate kinase [Fulvia fulva]UJO18988.1 Thymidylate kinase [Fulvia fulva]WPV16543.1 Thymidylate kinase [Fulvia fulva]WPV31251.1 Thymidylate kinase [Fulvia fulva]
MSHEQPSPRRGRLIVFEGLDRSGKSTQCERLVTWLREKQDRGSWHMRFPDRTTVIGQMINGYLQGASQQEDHAIHLLFSANRWEAADRIKQLISSGIDVVIDRYYYSGCVYSAAKQNPTMDLAWCRNMEVGLPRPDLCLFLDISAEDAAKRGGFGTERYEKQELQDRVRGLFAEMQTHPDENEDMIVIDAGGTVEHVQQTIQNVVIKRCLDIAVDQERQPLRVIKPW